uniref:Phenoloxidase-activating factor 2 n=1 Tax=Culicoides sonorensis TaxID=179676 RepID=A0A336MFL1_CULSO
MWTTNIRIDKSCFWWNCNDNCRASLLLVLRLVQITRKLEIKNKTGVVYLCAGALINSKVILTAAHCVEDYTPETLFVRAGVYNVHKINPELPHQNRNVHKKIIHEKFDRPSHVNNVALLILDRDFELGVHIRTICLPPAGLGEISDDKCIVAGWGKTGSDIASNYSEIPKKIELKIIPRKPCQNSLRQTKLGSDFELHESFICAQGDFGEDACKGDGGAPLVCPYPDDPSRYYEAGIVSWGIGCGENPGKSFLTIYRVYVNVAKYSEWVEIQLEKEDNLMAKQLIILLISFLFLQTKISEAEESIDDLIKDVFTSSTSNPIKTENKGQGQSLDELIKDLDKTNQNQGGVQEPKYCDGGRGECVPLNLCANNTIITDGAGIIDIRFSESSPCDYLSVCCGSGSHDPHKGVDTGGTSSGTIIERPITPPPVPKSGCGFHNKNGVTFKITGNTDESEFGEFPHMVAILKEEEILNEILNVYQCGGSLIAPNVVLTAAHCVATFVNAPSKLKIRAGEWDTQTKNEPLPHQDRNVLEVTYHKDYYKGGLYNDIALLFIEPVDLTQQNVGVLCLPPVGFDLSLTRCYASGWGKDSFGKDGKYQVILKKIELPIVSHQQCQESLKTTRLGSRFQLHSSFLCAGGETGKDTCKGDGGSPLVCPIPGTDRIWQAGIVAWGIGCGETGIPGVYASLPVLRGWVDEQFKLRNLDTNSYTYHD